MNSKEKIKTIFEYDNYREFLKDTYAAAKQKDSKFSFRYFSRIAGFKSSSMLKYVMDGKRNLSIDAIRKFAKALKLNRQETYFFQNLVLMNQATTVDERQTYAELLLKSKAYKKIHPLSEAQFSYCARWYLVPIREMIGLPGFKEDPEWIAKMISPPITPSEAKRALEELTKLGLIGRDPQGHLVQMQTIVATPDEVVSSFAAQFHKAMFQKASDSMSRYPRQARDISAVTLRLPPEGVKKIKEMIQQFRRELVEVATDQEQPNRVYQLSLALFPLSQILNEEDPAK